MIHRLKRSIELPISLDEAWPFFSNPNNLTILTPPELGMKITSEPATDTYAGQIITYTVSPILGILTLWVTEITHVNKPNFFVDEQRVGPYRMWHHQHRFNETVNGTTVEDIVDYIMPFGPLGDIIHALYVKQKLDKIFDYRNEILKDHFK